MNNIDLYAFQRAATHLHEIAHGLAALNCHVTKRVEVLEDAALIGWDIDSVVPGMRLQVHLAGVGANDYIDHGQDTQRLKSAAHKRGQHYWDHCYQPHHLEDPNTDYAKAYVAFADLLEIGVNAKTALQVANAARLKGALLAHGAAVCGLWAEVTSYMVNNPTLEDGFFLTHEHLARVRGVITNEEMEAIAHDLFD